MKLRETDQQRTRRLESLNGRQERRRERGIQVDDSNNATEKHLTLTRYVAYCIHY